MTAAFENRFIPASHDVDSLSPRVMNRADHYTTNVRWSDKDACWIGYCPDLFIGGVCHGNIRLEVSARLSILVEDPEPRPPPRAVLRPAARVRNYSEPYSSPDASATLPVLITRF